MAHATYAYVVAHYLMTKKDIYKLIPFGIASTLVLIHAIEVLLTPGYVNAEGNQVTYSMVDSVKYSGLGLLIVLALVFINRPVWKYLFAVITIVALTPLISFYSHTFSIGIGFLSFEVTALSLLIFHCLLNPEIFEFIKSVFETEQESEHDRQAKYEATVNGFERRFGSKSTEELRNIISKNILTNEAIEAAKRLLDKR